MLKQEPDTRWTHRLPLIHLACPNQLEHLQVHPQTLPLGLEYRRLRFLLALLLTPLRLLVTVLILLPLVSQSQPQVVVHLALIGI